MKTNSIASAVALGVGTSPVWGQALTIDKIENMSNNTLFTRWRPTSHFLAPAGWMNVWSHSTTRAMTRMLTNADQDPCGPTYDPVQNLYHLHYQFHPNHVNWGMTLFSEKPSEPGLTRSISQAISLGDTQHPPTSLHGLMSTVFPTTESLLGKTTKHNHLVPPI